MALDLSSRRGKSVQESVQEASFLFQAQRFSESASLCQQILKRPLDLVWKSACRFTLSAAQYELGQSTSALETLRAAKKEDISNPVLTTQLAEMEKLASSIHKPKNQAAQPRPEIIVLPDVSPMDESSSSSSSKKRASLDSLSSNEELAPVAKRSRKQTSSHLCYTAEASIPANSLDKKEIRALLSKIRSKEEEEFKEICPLYSEDLLEYQQALSAEKLPFGLILGRVESLGKGLFLKSDAKPIPEGTFIGFYSGKFILRDASLSNNGSYCFGLHETGRKNGKAYHLDIDANDEGNFTRFINHSSDGFNAECCSILSNEVPQIAIYTTKAILPGEQVLIDYGSSYWEAKKIEPIAVSPQTYQIDHRGQVNKSSK